MFQGVLWVGLQCVWVGQRPGVDLWVGSQWMSWSRGLDRRSQAKTNRGTPKVRQTQQVQLGVNVKKTDMHRQLMLTCDSGANVFVVHEDQADTHKQSTAQVNQTE